MSCLIIASEINCNLITETGIEVETEDSVCSLPNNTCLIFQTESNLPLKDEQDEYLETENSVCVIVNPSIFDNQTTINPDPYYIFTRTYGLKYRDEDPFKYTRNNNNNNNNNA